MFINSITNVNAYNKNRNKLQISQREVIQSKIDSNFSGITEFSGKYPTFKGGMRFLEKDIFGFVKNEVEPFLNDYKLAGNKNKTFYEAAKYVIDSFSSAVNKLYKKYNYNLDMNEEDLVKHIISSDFYSKMGNIKTVQDMTRWNNWIIKNASAYKKKFEKIGLESDLLEKEKGIKQLYFEHKDVYRMIQSGKIMIDSQIAQSEKLLKENMLTGKDIKKEVQKLESFINK